MAHNDSPSRVSSVSVGVSACMQVHTGLPAGALESQVRDWYADGDLDSYYGQYNGTGYNVTYVQDDQAGYGALTCSEVLYIGLLEVLHSLRCGCFWVQGS